jgi:DNA-binding Lrp family transcriptional regulator
MFVAFVFVSTEIGSEIEVLRSIKKIGGIEEAYMLYGVYDIVAKVKADTMDKLKEIVSRHIRRLDEVKNTLTMMVVD